MKQMRGAPQSEEEVKLNKIVQQSAQSNLTKCKFCGRSFNETAAAKHIPICEKKAKENAMKKGGKPIMKK